MLRIQRRFRELVLRARTADPEQDERRHRLGFADAQPLVPFNAARAGLAAAASAAKWDRRRRGASTRRGIVSADNTPRGASVRELNELNRAVAKGLRLGPELGGSAPEDETSLGVVHSNRRASTAIPSTAPGTVALPSGGRRTSTLDGLSRRRGTAFYDTNLDVEINPRPPVIEEGPKVSLSGALNLPGSTAALSKAAKGSAANVRPGSAALTPRPPVDAAPGSSARRPSSARGRT